VNDGQVRVAFCGLGRMGAEMVAALTDRGFPVTVWNRTPDKAAALAAATGAEAAESPASASSSADVVITMLTDGDAVLATLNGADGVLAGAGTGTVVVDCSTIGAEAAREAAALCAKSEVGFLDSPVSGSTVVARQGKLGLMVGGDTAVIDQARPVLDALGTVVHVGPTGAGAATKVAVNGLLHTFSTALSECMVAARTEGVSADALFDVLAAGVLWNRFLDYKRPSFSDPENTAVAFDLRTATKDLALAVAASNHAGLSASVVGRALELHQQALADGFGDRDMAAMAAWFGVSAGTNGDPALAGAPAPDGQPERN
jgi:3-hydroxyisobutyrate dehydrogenase-like beta-hydroxyacid dehydrogenase